MSEGAAPTPGAAARLDPTPGGAICVRCGGNFVCGARAGTGCDCMKLQLPAALTAELRRNYSDCLCLDCLRVLGATD